MFTAMGTLHPQPDRKPAAAQTQAGLLDATTYSQWRGGKTSAELRETAPGPPPERLLQSIWQHQRLQRQALRTIDGRAVRVLHPGFWNHEAGPDFHRAVIQLGNQSPASGDIEVDPRGTDWFAHGHAANPNFTGVILHVIWNGPAKTALPTLRLQPHLNAPLAELTGWHATEPPWPVEYAGQCRAPLAELPSATQDDLLLQAARERLRAKSSDLARLARAHGWDAALWHGLFRALGYKHNTWPMQNLAERLPALNENAPANATAWQARLLGVAGLLSDELKTQTPAAQKHLRALWDHWWRDRDALAEIVLPKTLWHLGGLRPANHPTRRLALLAHWLARDDLTARLEQWLQTDCPKNKLAVTLTEILAVAPDDFWKWHWTFKSARQSKPCSLLGATRVTDLAINAILPWFHARALAGENQKMLARIERRYRDWPPAQDNRVLKLARQRLFGGVRKLTGAAQQQGLLQIVRDFCDHAPATCEDCIFPDLVRSWPENFDGK